MVLKVNIICGEAAHGWIYSDFIEHFKKYSRHDIFVNAVEDSCDIFHFLPYFEYHKTSKPCTAWFSHMEQKDPLKSKFIEVAKLVDIGISQSKKYSEILSNKYGCKNIKNIITGVDTGIFCMRSTEREECEKLIVGYVGRPYSSSNRKNPKLLEEIAQLDYVDFRATYGKLEAHEVPLLIQSCDIIVSPSIYEGGPLCVQQSLACGVPVLCFSGVGVVDEFPHGVIKVPFNNSKEFISRLDIIWKTKSYLEWRKRERMNAMREQVKYQSWERFVRLHDRVWESLCV